MKTIIQIAITLVGLILGSWAGVFCIAFILTVLCAGEGAALGIICNDTPGVYITLLIVVVIFIIFGGILGYKGGAGVGKWITKSRDQGLGAAYCGMLLGDMGATVVVPSDYNLEEPDPPETASLYLDRNKYSIAA